MSLCTGTENETETRTETEPETETGSEVSEIKKKRAEKNPKLEVELETRQFDVDYYSSLCRGITFLGYGLCVAGYFGY